MYLSPLSPKLNKLLHNVEDNPISYLHTAEASALKKIFLDKIAKCLLSKQRALIIIPDGMSASVPAKLLSHHKLAHYSLHLTGKEKLSDQQIERLRRLYRLQEVPLESASYNTISQKQTDLSSHISEILNSINKESKQGPNLKTMILDEVNKPHSYIAPDTQRLLAELPIDHQHLTHIHRMQQCHQRHYDFMDAQGVIDPIAFTDHDHIAKAQAEIKELKEALSQSKIQIDLHLEAVRSNYKKKVEEEYNQFKEVREELKLAIFEHEMGEASHSFENVFQEIVAPLANVVYTRLHFQRNSTLNWGEAPLILEAINNHTMSLEANVDEIYNKYLGRLTPFNIELPALSDKLDRAQSILRAISNCEFLTLKTPKRYLQIAELIKHVKDVEDKLRLAEISLMDAGYCRYRELAHQALLSSELLRSLTSIEASSWSDVIKYFANQKQIKGHLHDQITQLPELLDQLRKTASQFRKINLQEIHNRWCKIREHSITYLKNEHWAAYQSIWINAQSDKTTLELYQDLGVNLHAFCPLAVVYESEAKKVLSVDNAAFDQVIFLDIKEINDKILKSFNNGNREISIISSYSIDTKDLKSTINKIYTSAMTLPNKPISTYTRSTEKYRHALSIAGHIADLLESCTIFKWMDQIVVSVANHKLNDKILEHLDVKAQHFLYRSTVEAGHIIEALLTESRVVLIGENQLINDHLTNDVLWQQYLLNELKKADIHLLSVSTLDLYTDRQSALDKLRLDLDRRVEIQEDNIQTEIQSNETLQLQPA